MVCSSVLQSWTILIILFPISEQSVSLLASCVVLESCDNASTALLLVFHLVHAQCLLLFQDEPLSDQSHHHWQVHGAKDCSNQGNNSTNRCDCVYVTVSNWRHRNQHKPYSALIVLKVMERNIREVLLIVRPLKDTNQWAQRQNAENGRDKE